VTPEDRRSPSPRSLLPGSASRAVSAGLFYSSILALAVVVILVFDWSAAYVAFPYESMDRVEGRLLEHAVRLTRGETIYPDANAEAAINCPHPPLYQAVCAVLVKAFGPSLFWTRLVSAAATLAVALLILAEVRARTGTWTVAVLSGLMWVALNGAVDGWFVRGRVDMLFVALSVGSLALFGRSTRGWRALAGAVLLCALAVFTRRNGVLVAAAGLGFLLIEGRWRRALVAGVAMALVLGALTAWMQVTTDGRFLHEILLVRRYGPRLANLDRLRTFGWTVGPLLAGGAAWFVHGLFRNRRLFASPYALALLVCAPFGALHHITEGGSDNAQVPMLALLMVVLGTWAGRLLKGPAPTLRRALLGAVVLLQAALLPVLTEKPGDEDWAAGRAIDQVIRDHPGPILMAHYQSYLVRQGRPVYDSIGAARELWVVGGWDPTRTVEDIRRRTYVLVLTDLRLEPEPIRQALRANYVPTHRLPLPRYTRRRPPLVVLVPRR